MKTNRKRSRKPDPLAARVAIKNIIAHLRAGLPELIPASDKELWSLLRAVVHAERHPEVDSRRGRKSHWQPAELERVRRALKLILARETKPVALRSFVEHYLLILDFPDEVAASLETGEINLFEAEQLARLTPARLGTTEAKLKKRRQALLHTHLQTAESGIRLKARVDALLRLHRNGALSTDNESASASRHSAKILVATVPLEAEFTQTRETIDVSGIEPDHLFYEYLHLILSLMKEIRPDQLSDKAIERLSSLAEQLIHQLNLSYKEQNPPPVTVDPQTSNSPFHI